MRVLLSVDMEGMPYIASDEELKVRGALFSDARRVATKIVVWFAEAFHRHGFEEVIIADSHGSMTNIDVESLPEYTYIIRGFPRPLSMLSGIERADAVAFIGYHAKSGTPKATFDHTFSSAVIDYVEVNGVEVSEYLFNTYVAGHFNKPVILVAGDKRVVEEAEKYTPWAPKIVFKEALSRVSCISPSMERIRRDIERAVAEAVERFRKGEAKPVKTSTPVEVKIRFLSTESADLAELLPFVERLDGKTVRFRAKDIVEAYKVIELLIIACYRAKST